MKILYLANIRLPSQKGETLQIMKTCEAFAKLGHQVELVVPWRHNPQLKSYDPFEFYNLEEKFKITRLPTIDLMPWQMIFGSLAYKINYWLFARIASLYARMAMADVIYSRDWRTLQLLRRYKDNLIFELHEYREKDAWAYQGIEPACKKIIVISHGLKRKLVSTGLTEEKISIAPDAVTLEEFNFNLTPPKAREMVNLPKEIGLVIYVGGLYRWKGIYTLIDAFKLLNSTNPDVKLILVGGMEADVQAVKDYLLEHETEGVVVVGYRPYTEIQLYMKAADILVLADTAHEAISREYTSPLKLFQYMAAKRTIVASGTQALREILDDDNAWLFTPDSPESLAEVIARALANQHESVKKVKYAYRDVQEHTWENRAKLILKKL